MRVFVPCEFSGTVRDAFLERGHEAVSCDLLPTERPGPHIQGDALKHLEGWDLIVAFPPCTYICGSGLHWNRRRPERAELTEAALRFFRLLLEAPCPRVCVENPVGLASTRIRKPDQIVHPWQFGHDASKATRLWLRGLPRLRPTLVLPGGRLARRANQTASGQNRLPPSPDRWKLRSLTYPGIARAMAEQWGKGESPGGVLPGLG